MFLKPFSMSSSVLWKYEIVVVANVGKLHLAISFTRYPEDPAKSPRTPGWFRPKPASATPLVRSIMHEQATDRSCQTENVFYLPVSGWRLSTVEHRSCLHCLWYGRWEWTVVLQKNTPFPRLLDIIKYTLNLINKKSWVPTSEFEKRNLKGEGKLEKTKAEWRRTDRELRIGSG